MFELPDEIWDYIKYLAFDWKRSHKQKMKMLESDIISDRVIYKRWTYFPPWPNTNDIIRDEYTLGVRDISWAPPPNLPLVSITFNVSGTGGWWAGYGWKIWCKTYEVNIKYFFDLFFNICI